MYRGRDERPGARRICLDQGAVARPLDHRSGPGPFPERRQASALHDPADFVRSVSLDTLRTLPSNRLEALVGDRKRQYSIRINRQWRIWFEWPEGQSGPSRVEIVDYHS